MAIKKTEAIKLTGAEENNIARFEAVIDQELQKKYEGRSSVTVDYKSLGLARPTQREIDGLVQLYKEAGWAVTVEHSHRGGSWFRFA